MTSQVGDRDSVGREGGTLDPSPNSDTLRFEDLFDLDEIQEIQDAFAKATGVASIITDPDGRPITKPSNFCRLCQDIIRCTSKGLVNCMASDAELGRHHPSGPIVRPCLSGGLYDAGASISVGDRHLANWLIGQVRNDTLDEERMLAYANEIGADREAFREALADVTEMPLEQFQAIAQGLYLTANLMSRIAVQSARQSELIRQLKAGAEERARLEAQLRQAQKMEAIGQLAGGVAHDFNNLITGIVGSAHLLARRLPAGSLEVQLTEEIANAGRRAGDLTHRLLAFARKGQLRAVPLDIHQILSEVVRLLSRSIDLRIEIETDLEAEASIVRGDPTQLQNAFLNLAVNARDAMADRGQLTFATRNVVFDAAMCRAVADAVAPGPYVETTVTDTGIGMSPQIQERIFEPFFTTKDVGEGTGLGLAAVFGCVQSHQGLVQVYSEEGRGSSFKVLLPVAPEGDAEPIVVARDEPIRGEGRILLVDDEEIVRNFASNALRELGYTVSTCRDGVEAVAWYEEHGEEVDLVVLDLIMPRLSGEETFRRIRELDPDAVVLLASGFSRNRVANTLLGEGARGFLGKPFGITELSFEVARILGSTSP